jgi:ribonuclease E
VEPGVVDVEPGVGTPLAEAAVGASDHADGTDAASEAPSVEHVPIKKKGSRKR